MLNAGVDYTQTTMQMQTLKNENTVLFNRELNDELVQWFILINVYIYFFLSCL